MSSCDSDGGLLICEEDLDNLNRPYTFSAQGTKRVFTYIMTPWRHCRPAVMSLVLLAAVLLIVDISLGLHYNKLKGARLPLDDKESVSNELTKLQDTYKAAVETMKVHKKELESEKSRQTQTNWEFEHQMRRSTNYENQLVKLTKDVAALRQNFPLIKEGCRRCPPGWILMNSMCYYFPFSDINGYKTWKNAREYCQLYGGDLAVIDSKDKENSTVNYLINNLKEDSNMGFWIGLKDSNEEGTWRWTNGTILVEGYWDDGEPNNNNNGAEDCAALYRKENFFMAWKDAQCETAIKWICEKAPTSMS